MNKLTILAEIRHKYPKVDKYIPEEKISIIEGREKIQLITPTETLYDRLSKFVHYDYKMNKIEKFKFVKDLPSKIRNELIYKMYRSFIHNFTFFRYNYQNGRNEAFNTRIMLSMRPVKVYRNEIIINEGETVHEMIFVKNGVLSVELDHKYFNCPIIALRKNDYFGVIQVLKKEKSEINLIVKSQHAEIFVINKNDLFLISYDYPEIFKEIFKNSSLNYSQMKQVIEYKKNKIESEEKLEKNNKMLFVFF